jgi:hypothetical protein
MWLSHQEHNEEWSMYAGLPVNIFAWSDLAECFNEDLLNKRVKHYQYMDKQFMDQLSSQLKWGTHTEAVTILKFMMRAVEITKLSDNNHEFINLEKWFWDDQYTFTISELNEELVEILILFNEETHDLYNYTAQKAKSWSVIITDRLLWKAYQRIVWLSAFLCWKIAWESSIIRKKLWFTYVPIEPILSFDYKQNSKVKVISKILHMSIAEMENKYKNLYLFYKEHIEQEKEKISSWLKKLWIDHNDIQDCNLCVQFSYTQEWKIDASIPPRIYVIDWDRAEFIS